MGAYLSAPITDKESAEGSNQTFSYGVAAMQGWRTDMEDAHSIVLQLDGSDGGGQADPTVGLFGVFDGHGGKEVAKFVANHLPRELKETEGYRAGDMDKALVQAFLRMDEILVLEQHREELNALRGSDAEDPKGKDGFLVDSSQLPESLLEVLGVPGPSGFQIRLIRSGPNGQGPMRPVIDDIIEDEEPDEDAEVAAIAGKEGEAGDSDISENTTAIEVEVVPGGGDAASAAAAAAAKSKRKRGEEAMQVDEGGEPVGILDAAEAEAVAEGDQVIEVEELSSPRSEEEWGGPSAGCTAVCALVRGNELVVANAGDSRCVLSRNGTAVALTQDHKPMDPEEYARIIKAGGFVAEGRVNGSLNLSRALGDLEYKQTKELPPGEQMVTALPEIRKEVLQPGDEFLLLACDGIWDVMTNQEGITFVRERLLAGKAPRQICEEICDHCLAPDTSGCGKGCDNMSVAVVLLKNFADAKIVAN